MPRTPKLSADARKTSNERDRKHMKLRSALLAMTTAVQQSWFGRKSEFGI